MNEIIPGYDCVAAVRKTREKRYAQFGGDMDAYLKSLDNVHERFLATLYIPENSEK